MLSILALAAPPLVAAANVTVNAIPGGGWVQGPDNTAGLAAVIAVSPAAGPGNDSVKLTTAAANTDAVGIGRVIAAPLSDISGGSWRTYVTGDSGVLASEPASLKFAMYRLGGTSEFTTLVVERVYSATVTPDVWQTSTLADDTMVWQTNTTEDFCLVAAASQCTFAQFKAHYPDATVLGLQVGIGSGIPVTTSYVDAITLAVGETTDTWNFELAAPAPTPRPTARPTGQPAPATAPPTDVAGAARTSPTPDGRAFIILGVVALVALMSVRLRRSRPTD